MAGLLRLVSRSSNRSNNHRTPHGRPLQLAPRSRGRASATRTRTQTRGAEKRHLKPLLSMQSSTAARCVETDVRVQLSARRLGPMMDSGEQGSTSNTAASPARSRSNWTASRVIGMVFASIGGLIGLALLAGGIAVIVSYAFGRDDDGYFNPIASSSKVPPTRSPRRTSTSAQTRSTGPRTGSSATSESRSTAQKPVFVGIGPDNDVDRYLGASSTTS